MGRESEAHSHCWHGSFPIIIAKSFWQLQILSHRHLGVVSILGLYLSYQVANHTLPSRISSGSMDKNQGSTRRPRGHLLLLASFQLISPHSRLSIHTYLTSSQRWKISGASTTTSAWQATCLQAPTTAFSRSFVRIICKRCITKKSIWVSEWKTIHGILENSSYYHNTSAKGRVQIIKMEI